MLPVRYKGSEVAFLFIETTAIWLFFPYSSFLFPRTGHPQHFTPIAWTFMDFSIPMWTWKKQVHVEISTFSFIIKPSKGSKK